MLHSQYNPRQVAINMQRVYTLVPSFSFHVFYLQWNKEAKMGHPGPHTHSQKQRYPYNPPQESSLLFRPPFESHPLISAHI